MPSDEQRPTPEPKPRKLTHAEKTKIREQLERGADVQQLAQEFTCSPSQVAGIKSAMSRRGAKGSIFVNVTAWVLLSLVVLSGLVGIFSAAGSIGQVFRLGRLQLRTTSSALIVMVVAMLPLWALLHYAILGKIRLFEAPSSWLERNGQLLELLSLALGLLGICGLLWLWLAG